MLEDGLELVRARGRVVGRTGRVRDGGQRRLVDRPAEARPAATPAPTAAEATATVVGGACARLVADELLPAARVLGARVVGPEADRVDADPAIGGLLGGLGRVRPGVAGAIGQEDDDVGGIRALGDRRRRAARRGVLGLTRGDGLVDLGDRVDRLEDGAADRRPPTGRQAS